MKRGYLSKIVYSNFLWGSGVLLLLIASLFDFLLPRGLRPTAMPESFQIITTLPIFGNFFTDFFPSNLVQHIFQFLYLAFTAYLIQHLVSKFRLIRVRSFFPFFISCILSATILPLVPFDGTFFANLLFVLSFLRLLSAQENVSPTRASFDASILLIFASLLQPHILYLLPIYWLVMIVLQVMTFRTFITSLLGVVCVGWLVVGLSFLLGDWRFIQTFLNELLYLKLLDVYSLPKPATWYLLFLAVLFLSAMLYFWPKQHLEKLKTRNCINSILLVWFGLLGIWFFSPNYSDWLLILMTISSLILAHFFSLVDTLYTRFMLLAMVASSIVVYLYF